MDELLLMISEKGEYNVGESDESSFTKAKSSDYSSRLEKLGENNLSNSEIKSE